MNIIETKSMIFSFLCKAHEKLLFRPGVANLKERIDDPLGLAIVAYKFVGTSSRL